MKTLLLLAISLGFVHSASAGRCRLDMGELYQPNHEWYIYGELSEKRHTIVPPGAPFDVRIRESLERTEEQDMRGVAQVRYTMYWVATDVQGRELQKIRRSSCRSTSNEPCLLLVSDLEKFPKLMRRLSCPLPPATN